MTTIIIVILIILLVAGLPIWYSRGWRGGRGYGYITSGVIGVILLIGIILYLVGRL